MEPATGWQVVAAITFVIGLTFFFVEFLAIVIDWRHED